MAQFVVRNIEAEVKARLRRRAARHGRSMEEEVRDILRNAVKVEESLSCAVIRSTRPSSIDDHPRHKLAVSADAPNSG